MNKAIIFLSLLCMLSLTSCAQLTLAWADLDPDGQIARPEVLGVIAGQRDVTTVEAWENERAPMLREHFERYIYGAFPDSHETEIISREVLDDAAFNGAGQLIEYKLRAKVWFGGEARETNAFYMDVVAPIGVKAPPVILMQTFCPRWDTIPHPAIARPEEAGDCGGPGSGIMKYVFGRYIATPPIEMILARGYAIATIYPSEFVPDRSETGLAALKRLSAGVSPGDQRWGAIAAWAWGFSLMVDALEADDNVAAADYITFGHSRYGKSALVAAAYDGRISGVIAHQSGTGGASLNLRKRGESVKAITKSYPHWFANAYSEYAGREEDLPVDQHQLLALIAPRPILLGNARRDVWSDPNGAFRAAIGADPAYELYGSGGLEQERLSKWTPSADIAFWIRPGTHGVVKEDWPAFLEFLDAHFTKPDASAG